jgi:hypothetical protein
VLALRKEGSDWDSTGLERFHVQRLRAVVVLRLVPVG